MTVVTIGSQEVALKATPLALLFYKQEFGSDLLADLAKFEQVQKNLANLDTVAILQLIWAMAKAANGLGKPFPPFAKWLEGLDSIDFSDADLINAVVDEAANGFFRSRRPHPKTK